MRQVAIHMMAYVDMATANMLSPDILHVENLRCMLRHIEFELPSTMHLPIDDIFISTSISTHTFSLMWP